jgi:hypothetical protein
MLFNALTLLPELTTVANVNDDAAHELFVVRANEAIDRGGDPVDFWVADLDLGFPQFLYYQHLPHLAVVGAYRALLGTVNIVTVFNAVRFGLLVAFPLTVLWCMRRMGFGGAASAFGATAASLLSTRGLLGLDYDSYVWRGSGVFTQLAAMHLFFVGLALLEGVLRRGRGYAAATIALAALVLSHLLYAYMMVISAGIIAVAARWHDIPVRIGRIAFVGLVAAAMSAYLLVPAALTGYYLNASPYLDPYKYDSYGAGPILGWLVTGRLLDADRLPVLTVLLAVGIVAAVTTRARPALTAVALFVVWLILYFGRPTLGVLVDLFPLHQTLFFHRFIGGVHVAAILLIGVGCAWLWGAARPWATPRRLAVAAVVAGLALVPLLWERASYYADNATWIGQTRVAIDRDADAHTILAALSALPAGRVYAGQARDWGDQLDFGLPFRSARMYHELIARGVPTLATPVQGVSLNSDLLFDFDPADQSHYGVFGVRYVVAPSTWQPPGFLVTVRRTPLYTLFATQAGAGARYAAVADTIRVPAQADLLPVMRGWLLSAMPRAGEVVRIEYPVGPAGATGATAPGCPVGAAIGNIAVDPGRVTVEVSCPTAATLVLPITFHPNWQVSSDGAAIAAFMVSPSVIGISLPPGRHVVTAEYRSTPMKAPLLALGGLVLVGVVVGRSASRWRDRRTDGGPRSS